jgi:hypothetical protein
MRCSRQIRAKRAWGEVKIPLAEMSLWPDAVYVGHGNALPRRQLPRLRLRHHSRSIMMTARLWNHFASLMYDWASVGATSQIVQNQHAAGLALQHR